MVSLRAFSVSGVVSRFLGEDEDCWRFLRLSINFSYSIFSFCISSCMLFSLVCFSAIELSIFVISSFLLLIDYSRVRFSEFCASNSFCFWSRSGKRVGEGVS